jgi:hypothetical protein
MGVWHVKTGAAPKRKWQEQRASSVHKNAEVKKLLDEMPLFLDRYPIDGCDRKREKVPDELLR